MTTAAALGSIPFRIRVGVTGHRTVDSRPLLGDVIREIRQLLPADGATPVRLAVVSALAEGADRLVAQEIFADADAHGEEARLEAVLPFERRRYSELQEFAGDAEAEFATWLDQAVSVTELAGAWEPATRERAYEAAGRYVVSRCDVLVGVWDGRPSRGRGGTAETLLYAAETGKPSIWLPTDGSLPRLDNLGAGTTAAFQKQVRERALPGAAGPVRETLHREALEQLRTTFRKLDAFNSARLPAEPALRRRVEAELGPVDETSDWIAWPFARAASLADRAEARFIWATRFLTVLAVGAAVALGFSAAETKDESLVWGWTEFACLVALVGLFAIVRRAGLHARWLSYRLLAERFRSAYFIAPTGIDFRRTAGLETVFVDRRSADWLLRAFEEVWDSRPRVVNSWEGFEGIRNRLADDWIGGQIAFHKRARHQHERLALTLEILTFVCFFGTIAFALVRAITPAHRNPMIIFSVALPIAAGALGVLATVRQHRALAERYARMRTDLVAVRRALLDADARTITKATSEAARVIAEENGDWFGAMWFLDVEHP